ncbi:MAG: ATP-dependent DNA ligase [Thaumarchaeota archaeon]|nr:ATP-dependent DNA ligase [Nitrososphaerota archaeon]
MEFSKVAECYSKIESISSRNQMTGVLAEFLRKVPMDEIPCFVYLTQGKLRPDYEGVELGVAEKMALRALSAASGATAEKAREIYVKEGDIGSAAELLLGRRSQGTLYSEQLTLRRVYDSLMKVARHSGEGSVESKQKEIVSLLNDASPLEAKYIMRTVTGVLRLGLADYTVLDAAALAFLGDRKERPKVERAYNIHPDLGFVVQTVASKGAAGIQRIRVKVGVPIRPMLAERLDSAEAIMKKMGEKKVAAEYKLDGERLQIHKDGKTVVLFSRRLEVITSHYPDAVRLVQENIAPDAAILEAEVVAVNPDTGEYLPFQELMHRRRKYGVEEAMAQYPIALNFFDVLLEGTKDVTGEAYSARRKALSRVVKNTERTRLVPSLGSSRPQEIEDFMEEAISNGCEGLVVKDPGSPYRAGAREFAWIKLKREYRSELADTMDLAVIGAFHGKGRRTGSYGTYLLAAYDQERALYTSVAKVGTGFTDEDLSRIPKLLKPYGSKVRPADVEAKMEPDVWFRPHLVIEVIASELTLSPIHTAAIGRVRPGAGLSLRFPKFTGKVRDDKRGEDATTVAEILGMYNGQLKKVAGPR